MLVVIGIMLGGIIVGYLFRHASWKGLPTLITLFIWILLFLLGNEIGRDEQVVRSFHSLGMEAAMLTFAAVTGSTLCAWLLWMIVRNKNDKKA